ncbi:DUF1365 domain-containing protein [Kitasatospora camelliae]|uniref:DUF1365 domain-containing protein n=1 Tax=Kitasatospora camelliae TaxID=3156397 RepID=A0AAU8K7V4_9ACTN
MPGPWGAALYDCRITHVRTTPLRHAFRLRTPLWLVDLDRLPPIPAVLRPLARFRAADHPGDPARSLRRNLDDYLASQGVHLDGGRVLMLTQARSLGYVFNPLTVYWCHGPDGRPVCTVAEVHNTYGAHHRYLLRPDRQGRAEAPKELYVSPFFPVDGRYRMSLPEPGPLLRLTIHLDRPGGRAFTAAVSGERSRADARTLVGTVLRHPFATRAVSLRIRLQGIRLLLRGLPVQPRGTAPAAAPADDPARTPDPAAHQEVPTP